MMPQVYDPSICVVRSRMIATNFILSCFPQSSGPIIVAEVFKRQQWEAIEFKSIIGCILYSPVWFFLLLWLLYSTNLFFINLAKNFLDGGTSTVIITAESPTTLPFLTYVFYRYFVLLVIKSEWSNSKGPYSSHTYSPLRIENVCNFPKLSFSNLLNRCHKKKSLVR